MDNQANDAKELLADKIAREKAEKEAAEKAAAKEAAEKAIQDASAKEAEKKAKKASEKAAKKTAAISDDVAEFFEQYPNAPSVLKAGDCLYLAHQSGAASDHARRFGVEVEEIKNPNL